jgi:endo-1,4-beta-mannosidase
MTEFTLGVNYWPRRSAMYMWEQFDAGEIREDAVRMRALGLRIVRFFLRWDSFQPAPDTMNEAALQKLATVMDAFAAAGLVAMPTLFCGHMSGVNWLPAWTLDPKVPHGHFRTITGTATSRHGIGDFYADSKLLEAQLHFARAVGERLRGHPALYLWDLGNEFSNLRVASSPDIAANWSARLSIELLEHSDAGVTGGLHGDDVEHDRGIRPSTIALPWELATMHGYSVYSKFSRGRLDANVVPFLAQLIAGFTGKPMLFSEFGNPTCAPGETTSGKFACLSEHEMEVYCYAVLDRLQRCGAIGAMWWSWADYARELADVPPFDHAAHELAFGVLRTDGTEKPVARAIERFVAEHRPVLPVAPPIAKEAEYYAGLPETLLDTYAHYCSAHSD